MDNPWKDVSNKADSVLKGIDRDELQVNFKRYLVIDRVRWTIVGVAGYRPGLGWGFQQACAEEAVKTLREIAGENGIPQDIKKMMHREIVELQQEVKRLKLPYGVDGEVKPNQERILRYCTIDCLVVAMDRAVIRGEVEEAIRLIEKAQGYIKQTMELVLRDKLRGWQPK